MSSENGFGQRENRARRCIPPREAPGRSRPRRNYPRPGVGVRLAHAHLSSARRPPSRGRESAYNTSVPPENPPEKSLPSPASSTDRVYPFSHTQITAAGVGIYIYNIIWTNTISISLCRQDAAGFEQQGNFFSPLTFLRIVVI